MVLKYHSMPVKYEKIMIKSLHVNPPPYMWKLNNTTTEYKLLSTRCYLRF